MKNRIHLNNAGASLMSDSTLDAMIDYLRLEQKIGGYEAAAEFSEELEKFYKSVARLVGCDGNNVAFSDSATRAWNTILFSMTFDPGDRILTTSTEFGSNVLSLQSVAERTGAELIVLEVQENGEISLEELLQYDDGSLKLVALSHAPAHCGSVINAAEIGEALEDSSAFYLLDACQTLGQFNISVRDIKCDALVGTGRKWLRGPRGTGFAFANDRLSNCLKSVSVDLANADWLSEPRNGSQVSFFKSAQRLQTWERSYAAQLGLTIAIDEFIVANERTTVSKAIARNRKLVSDAVSGNDSLIQYPGGNGESGVVTFYSESQSAEDIKQSYTNHGINVSLMSSWDAPWDFAGKGLPTLVRVSPHYFNTESEISQFAEVTESLGK